MNGSLQENGTLITIPRHGMLWINNEGILHIQTTKAMHPVMALVCGLPMYFLNVGVRRKKMVPFTKASDIIKEFPEKREIIEQIAEKHGAKI